MCDGCVTALRDKLASQSDVNNKGFIFKPLTYFFFLNNSLYNSLLQVSPSRLTFEDFQQLLSVVGVKSLREEDPQLISLLSMRATWFLSLFPWVSVIIFFTRLWFWVIRYRIRKRNSLAFRALKNVMSDRDEKKKQNKTEQETESKKLSTKKYGTVWCKKKKNDFGEIWRQSHSRNKDHQWIQNGCNA